MIQKVIDQDQIIAILIKNNFKKNGIEFFTPQTFSQQLGYMFRPCGYKIKPHVHNIKAREVQLTQEVLYIKSGKIRIDFYSLHQDYIESIIVSPGDVILLASGGHGFVFLEESEIIEVKQGPYIGEEDKLHFNHVQDSQIKIVSNE
jgi:hypothetical protein